MDVFLYVIFLKPADKEAFSRYNPISIAAQKPAFIDKTYKYQ